MDHIKSISTEDIMPKSKEDKKCAPGREFKNGSCFETNELLHMVDAYNKEHINDKIDLKIDNNLIKDLSKKDIKENFQIDNKKHNGSSYKSLYMKYDKKLKKVLLKELHGKLGGKCKTQKCWTEQKFMDHLHDEVNEHIQENILRPYGPSVGRKWLNTVNIDEVLEQYENIYTDFKFLGTMPRDFQDHDGLKQDADFYKELFKSGKTKLGMVYNTDKLGESGEHWNGMFCDFTKGLVLFFDSYGVEPSDETKKHMELLGNVMKEVCGEVVKTDYNHNKLTDKEIKCNMVKLKRNDKRHQYKGSECGVYSINFIERMLKGDSFEEICNSKIPDDIINKEREKYFYKE